MTTTKTTRTSPGDSPVDPETGATRRELKGTDEVKDSTAYQGEWFGKPADREPHEATTPAHTNQNPEEGSESMNSSKAVLPCFAKLCASS